MIGRKLVQVAEFELHKARGFKSLEQYAESELALSRDSALLYTRVAQAFSETVAATFGPEKLDRALRYIAATPEDEKLADIPKLKILVTTADGKVYRRHDRRSALCRAARARDDIAHLLDLDEEVVVAQGERPSAVRLQSESAPESRHRRLAYPRLLRELAHAPVRGTLRLCLQRKASGQ